tara:strand:+ start:171 stop:746 length:576 start_codon:yes stop_codon:yes gene_type:complete
MKKILQLLLFGLLIILSVFFYIYYLKENEQIVKNTKEIESEILIQNQNNLIKNLSYEVKLDNNTQYKITSELSELIYENGIEIVKMQKVSAEFIDRGKLPLIIKSENANYNNMNYNTNFYDQVIITYDNNIISSNKLDLDFTENIVTIYDNVVYEGLNSSVKTDNIKINLITRKINIFMNDTKKKVKLISK